MSMSGIAVSDEVKKMYKEIQKGKLFKYAAFRLNEDKTAVVVDEKFQAAGIKTTSEQDVLMFQEMKGKLKHEEPRYIVYDFGFTSKEGRRYDKLAFFYWCSDNGAPLKLKMTYTATKDSVLKSFQGIAKDFQINDIHDFDYDEMSRVIEKVR